jgi:hypothetical protein
MLRVLEGMAETGSILVPATGLPGPPTSVGTWGGGLKSAAKAGAPLQ